MNELMNDCRSFNRHEIARLRYSIIPPFQHSMHFQSPSIPLLQGGRNLVPPVPAGTIPNTKYQISNHKSQIIPNTPNSKPVWNFDIVNLKFICYLVFVIWCFIIPSFHHSMHSQSPSIPLLQGGRNLVPTVPAGTIPNLKS
jgi:hypothetical protein